MTTKSRVKVYYLEPSDDMQDSEIARRVRFNGSEDAVREAASKGFYKLAAEVFDMDSRMDTFDMLDKAYVSTNNIHTPWTENSNVTCMTARPRSCSVGDVMELNGEYYSVSPIGFKNLPDFSIQKERVSKHKLDDISPDIYS